MSSVAFRRSKLAGTELRKRHTVILAWEPDALNPAQGAFA